MHILIWKVFFQILFTQFKKPISFWFVGNVSKSNKNANLWAPLQAFYLFLLCTPSHICTPLLHHICIVGLAGNSTFSYWLSTYLNSSYHLWSTSKSYGRITSLLFGIARIRYILKNSQDVHRVLALAQHFCGSQCFLWNYFS